MADTFGTQLRRARNVHGLSLRELARQSGVHHITIWKLEQDKHLPLPATVAQLERVLGPLPRFERSVRGRA